MSSSAQRQIDIIDQTRESMERASSRSIRWFISLAIGIMVLAALAGLAHHQSGAATVSQSGAAMVSR